MYKEMLKTALMNDNSDIGDIAENIFEVLKEKDPEEYWNMFFDLYEANYGKKLNLDMATEWVNEMKPYGEHWTKADTDNVRASHGISLNDIDFYAIMNMCYNDYPSVQKVPNASEDEIVKMYASLACDWLKDIDFPNNKPYAYRKMIIENNL